MHACCACMQLHCSRCLVVPLLDFLLIASSSSCKAEQPAWNTRCVHDVTRLLAGGHIASCNSLGRIEGTLADLLPSRPGNEDVGPLRSNWQIPQKKDKHARPLNRCAPRIRKRFGSSSAEVATLAYKPRSAVCSTYYQFYL